MPIPDDIYDEGVNYRIRLCLRFEENPMIGFITDSKTRLCDGCASLIWVKEDQVVPEADVPITGDLFLCMECCREVAAKDPDGPPEWLGPNPSELGIPDPFA